MCTQIPENQEKLGFRYPALRSKAWPGGYHLSTAEKGVLRETRICSRKFGVIGLSVSSVQKHGRYGAPGCWKRHAVGTVWRLATGLFPCRYGDFAGSSGWKVPKGQEISLRLAWHVWLEGPISPSKGTASSLQRLSIDAMQMPRMSQGHLVRS